MSIDEQIATAKTAADHEAIAAYFDKQAAAAKAEAKAHSTMAEAYKKVGGAAIGKLHLDQHCDKIEASYEAVARENEDRQRLIEPWPRNWSTERATS